MGTPAAGPHGRGGDDVARRAPTVVLRLFAGARQAAGTGRAEIAGATVGEALGEAERRYGAAFSRVLAASRVWVNGAPADPATLLAAGDELAVLPPVSGGDGSAATPLTPR